MDDPAQSRACGRGCTGRQRHGFALVCQSPAGFFRLAFSGWLAALFLLGFIGLALEFVFRNSTAAFVLGGLMVGGAYAVLRLPKNEFLEHLTLAVSLAGQCLIIYAIFDSLDGHETAAWLALFILQGSLAAVMPNYVHRIFSAFIAASALAMTLTSLGWPHVGGILMFLAALCWLHEFDTAQHMEKLRAIGYGLVLALIQLKSMSLFGEQALILELHHQKSAVWAMAWIDEVLIGCAALYVVWQLLQRHSQAVAGRISVAALAGTVLICAVSTQMQGLTVGLVIMLLGFAGSNRVLAGLGITSLLFYISTYYYQLDATLLAKSLNLLAVGLVLLGIRQLLEYILPEGGEVRHV